MILHNWRLPSRWLALVSCLNLLQTVSGQVAFNEILFHPQPAVPENPAAEWVELQNRGSAEANLNGWRISKGVAFTFTNVTIPAGGYLVIAADLQTFKAAHPGVTNAVGNWTGKVGNNGDRLELSDNTGKKVDSVSYFTEGDWAERRPGAGYPGQPNWWSGWSWITAAAGGGSSLELVNTNLPGESGQNWASSLQVGGTPGAPNSVATNSSAPLILNVSHWPVVPKPGADIFLTGKIVCPAGTTANVHAFWRIDGSTNFDRVVMLDNGNYADGAAGDKVFGCRLPGLPNKTIVEFYIQADDGAGHVRSWPAPTDANGTHGANALFQVEDSIYTGNQPLYRLVIKQGEWAAWLNLMNNVSGGRFSDAEMNATVVRTDGSGTAARYCVGIRNRGAGTRAASPHNMHISIPRDNALSGISRLDFNSRTVHSQVAGNALLSTANLLNAYGAAAQLRINGDNLAHPSPDGSVDSYQFGSYYCFQPYDSDWARTHFPDDPGGNIYKGVWYFDGVQLSKDADLNYLGEDAQAYKQEYGPSGPTASTGPYSKQSNSAEDDWSDLIGLTRALSTNTPASTYVQEVSRVANIDQWLSYVAANSLILNMETTLATGAGDDYSSYRGVKDPRFVLLNHDLDTVLGQGDATPSWARSIFKAAELPVLSRLLKDPGIAPRYFGVLKGLAEGAFATENVNRVLDRSLKGWVTDSVIQEMKDAGVRRLTNVLAQIPLSLSITSTLPVANGFLHSTSAQINLSGGANAIRTRQVLVNGSAADYVPWQGSWSKTSVQLFPGINRVLVQCLDTNAQEFARTTVDVWLDTGRVTQGGGTISSSTSWTAAAGPYLLTNDLVIAGTGTLTIEPGTTVYLSSGVDVIVQSGGRLLAEGTETAPIRFATQPGSTTSWGGITINGSGNSPETRIVSAQIQGNGTTCIEVAGGTLYLAKTTFLTTTHQYLSLDGASFLIEECHFPAPTTAFEPLHGTAGIKSGGRGIVQRCYFGSPIGYNDVFDFTGGNRDLSQPLLHFLNNVCAAASDDILDLDGTDAWIEGNIFLHTHRNGSPDSSSAVSGGDAGSSTSELTVLRNIFFDCDNAVTVKQGNFATLFNNTIIKVTKAGGTDSDSGVVNLRDTEPDTTTFGRGAYLQDNIIWDVDKLVRNYDPSQSEITLVNNILPANWAGPGSSNITNSPGLRHVPSIGETQFKNWQEAQILWEWLSPASGSPATGRSSSGGDLGATVPAGITASGLPALVTSSRNANFRVGPLLTPESFSSPGFPAGSGYVAYKWRIDGGQWSGEVSATNSIVLGNLSPGQHTLEVDGKRDSGMYQSSPELGQGAVPATMIQWVVDPNLSLRLNEVLAWNVSTLVTNGSTPDLIELYNAGTSPLDLSGKSISRNATNTQEFVFPTGTMLKAGEHMVLMAGKGLQSAGYLGFGLNRQGGALYLFDSPSNGGALIDSVVFGTQAPDYSIGPRRDGTWGLCVPTFGAANLAISASGPSAVKINEWLAGGSPALPSDFIELYNTSEAPAEISGCYITDSSTGVPARNQLAPLSYIGPKGFAVFQADSKSDVLNGHLDFHLALEFGSIGLFSPGLELIDSILYGPQTPGIAEGRTPNGSAETAFLSIPTPGAANPGNTSGNVVTVTTSINLIPLTNSWKFQAVGAAMPADWIQPQFDDTSWPAGMALLGRETSTPFPYSKPILTPLSLSGTNGSAVITYYFRTSFLVPTNLAGFTLQASTYLDDGAVFYVNGRRITAIRISTNPTAYSDYAQNQPSEGAREMVSISAADLTEGTNTLAVEVHQVNSSSSDIVFGMELLAIRTVSTTNYTQVVLNEVFPKNMSKPDADGVVADGIELFNPAGTAADISGFSLTDDLSQPRKWIVPSGVSVAPQSFLVVRCDPAAPASTVNGQILNSAIRLSASAGKIYLFDGAGSLNDALEYGAVPADLALGRVPDGSASWQLTIPTLRGVNLASALGDQATIRINEWAANVANGPDWLELYNPSGNPVSLQGLFLTDRPDNRTKHQIAPLTFIAANGYLKFVADGNTSQGQDHLNFSLDSQGESIALFPPDSASAIDVVFFGPQTAGTSEGRLPDGAARVLKMTEPSPGKANWVALTNVVINEVLGHAVLPLEEAIEIHNVSDATVDISGWGLSDSELNLAKYRIPAGTLLPAKGFAVVYSYQFGQSAFALNKADGSEVWLTEFANGIQTGERDHVSFGPQFTGAAVGTVQTSTGRQFATLNVPTFGVVVDPNGATNLVEIFRTGAGAANSGPKIGPVVISEIMFHPPLVGGTEFVSDEFVVLQNISNTTLPLCDASHPTNGWRMSQGVEFTFNTNHILGPGERVVLVGFNPEAEPLTAAAFRAKYRNTNARLVGPWAGRLENSGETLTLSAPDPGADGSPATFVAIDTVSYSSRYPWPAGASGTGLSLHRVNTSGYGNEVTNWVADLPAAGMISQPADTDADGMPDQWEEANGLDKLVDDSALDADGDGFSNIQEYQAGTNPKDKTSALKWEAWAYSASQVQLRFTAMPNRSYSVMFSDSASAAQWVKLRDLAPQSTQTVIEVVDNAPTALHRFYRLVTPALP